MALSREELKNKEFEDGSKLTKEVIDYIMAEHGQTVEENKKLKENVESLTTERDGLSEQLKSTNKQIKEFKDLDVDSIKKNLEDLQIKYDTDTKELNDKLSKQNYDFRIQEATAGIKFSSNAAKKSFMEDLSKKGLKLEDNKIMGFDDFLKSYKEADPNAFVKEESKSNDGIVVNSGDNHGGSLPKNNTNTLLGALREQYNK